MKNLINLLVFVNSTCVVGIGFSMIAGYLLANDHDFLAALICALGLNLLIIVLWWTTEE